MIVRSAKLTKKATKIIVGHVFEQKNPIVVDFFQIWKNLGKSNVKMEEIEKNPAFFNFGIASSHGRISLKLIEYKKEKFSREFLGAFEKTVNIPTYW